MCIFTLCHGNIGDKAGVIISTFIFKFSVQILVTYFFRYVVWIFFIILIRGTDFIFGWLVFIGLFWFWVL
jgi:hypothetical protein